MDAKLLATIIAIAKKEAGTQARDLSVLERKVEDKLKEFHKRSPILDLPTFAVKNGCLHCTWSSGLALDFGNIVGPQGSQGIQGVQGPQGVAGKDGTSGKDGINGKDGQKGKDGIAAAAGRDGVDGKQGLTGAVGPRGEPGQDGKQGVPGNDGKAAERGAQGLPGLDGDDGEDGVGVEKAWVDDNYHLTIKLTSGKVIDTGYVRGPAGVSSGKGGRVTGATYIGGGASSVTSLGKGGYELTGGFTDRTTGTAGASDIGTDVEYTQGMVTSGSWLRFGLDATRQLTSDTPYWTNGPEAYEAPHTGTTDYQGVGLFSGYYMPPKVTSLFNFTDNTAYSTASTTGDLQYNAATGSYDMSQLKVGDQASFRFSFNVTPTVINTTVEVGLIWSTRDANNNITFTFPLTTQPIFFGAGTAGVTYLNRPLVTAYMASHEDVNARALPAIRSDNPVFIQPLTTLFTVGR